MAARPLTVMQLLPALDAGGVERSTLEIAAALADAGHRALVVSAGGRLEPVLDALGASHVRLAIGAKSPLVLRHVGALRRLVQQRGVDIVHARSRLPAWLAWRALAGLPAPRPRFVTTVHGLNSPGRYSAVMTRGERVICVSDTVRAHLLANYPGIDPARLVVIERGVDAAVLVQSAARDRAAIGAEIAATPALAGRRLLLLPGRATRLKGQVEAIALLATLVAEGRDLALWLPGAAQHGRDRYRRELERNAREAGVADRVLIEPPRAELPAIMRAATLVLQLSNRPEAFGRTAAEALALGVPVLGLDHGGVGELLAAHYPAGRVAPGNAAALAAHAGQLLDAPPPVPAWRGPTLAAMQRATLALYDELVDAPGADLPLAKARELPA